MILLTDGSQTPSPDAEDPTSISDELRSSGITLLVVGIGADVNAQEMSNIAGNQCLSIPWKT